MPPVVSDMLVSNELKGIGTLVCTGLNVGSGTITSTGSITCTALTVNGSAVTGGGSSNITMDDNTTDAWTVKEGSNNYINLDTTNSSEAVNVHQDLAIRGSKDFTMYYNMAGFTSKMFEITGSVMSDPSINSHGNSLRFKALGDPEGNGGLVYMDHAASTSGFHPRYNSDSGVYSLGKTSARWKDLFLTGDVTATNGTFSGAVSKGSGSFKIDHPLESKKDTHYLVHSFIEGPNADLIYRGKIDLSSGTAAINIDTSNGMTKGTFVALCNNIQSFTTNETGWDCIKSSVSGSILEIQSNDPNSSASVSWMVIGERKDKHMIETSWTDSDGKVVVEPAK
jgi:hypothetical protein